MTSGSSKREPKTVMDAALDLIARAALPIAELRLKLLRKGYNEGEVEGVVSRLREMGYLNDEVYARDWVERRQHVRPAGHRLLRNELDSKGIDADTIERVMARTESEYGDFETALKAADRWIGLRSGQRAERRQADKGMALKLASHLRSRGFDSDTIARTVRCTLCIELE